MSNLTREGTPPAGGSTGGPFANTAPVARSRSADGGRRGSSRPASIGSAGALSTLIASASEAGRRNAVVLVTDAALFPATAFAAERLAALNPRTDTDIIVFTDSVRDVAVARNFNVSFRMVTLDAEALNARFPGGAMETTWYRFSLPAMLGPDYRRMLYIDTDTYVHDDRLFSLFDLDMENHAVAAVRDLLIAISDGGMNREILETLKEGGRKYMNCGVLLFDLDRSAAMNLFAKVIEVVAERRRAFGYRDQSALNTVLDGDWLELSPAFNMLPAEYASFVRDVFPPVVVHFAGSDKPWHGPKFPLDHPARAEIEAFMPTTPWKRFLGQFYGFRDAWQAIIPDYRPARPARTLWPQDYFARGIIHRAMTMRHLRETEFADVRAGITQTYLDRLPKA